MVRVRDLLGASAADADVVAEVGEMIYLWLIPLGIVMVWFLANTRAGGH